MKKSELRQIIREEITKLNESSEKISSIKVEFIKGWGYWDVTKYPYGGDFKRFKGNETGLLMAGPVKRFDEIRVKMGNNTIVAPYKSVSNMSWDELQKTAKSVGIYKV